MRPVEGAEAAVDVAGVSVPNEGLPVPPVPGDRHAADDAWDFSDPRTEQEYREARRYLLDPPIFRYQSLLLIGTLILFVLSWVVQAGGGAAAVPSSVVLIVGVLLFHELGHYAGMWAFGYRDVRMFFIPFFGAAVSGRRSSVARWKQAVVLLLGPLPGIGLGFALMLMSARWPAAGPAALMLVIINGLNLLPVAPLDGGQFFQVLLFSRHRYLELVFVTAAALALGAAALRLQDVVLGILGYAVLGNLPYRWRLLREAQALRDEIPDLPADPSALGNSQCRRLFTSACAATGSRWRERPRVQARVMDELLERAVQRTPSWRASVALFAAWACGMVAVLVAVVGLRDIGPPTEWQSYASSAAGFDVEFPTAPIEKTNGAGAGSVMATRGSSRAYAVGWFALPDDGSTVRDWLIRRRDDLLKGAGGGESVLEREEPPGEHDVRFAIRLPNGTVHDTRVVVANGRMFTLIAAAPSVDADGRRFLDSFHAWSEPGR